MRRPLQILSVFLLLALSSAVSAQTPLTCGIVDVDGPAEVVPGTALVFSARLTGMTHTTPEFKWKVSAGTITGGQGTEVITVDTAGLSDVEVIATVELSGAPLGCKGSGSRTTRIKEIIACGLPFDQYGDLKFNDEKARLDNFAIQVTNEPLSIGVILMFAGKETFEKETAERLDRAKSYLVNVRKIDSNRIVTVDCGFTQDLTITLYVAPPGAPPPPCGTGVEVPFSEVKFTKPRPKTAKKPR